MTNPAKRIGPPALAPVKGPLVATEERSGVTVVAPYAHLVERHAPPLAVGAQSGRQHSKGRKVHGRDCTGRSLRG